MLKCNMHKNTFVSEPMSQNHLRQLSDDSPGASSAHSFLTSSRHAFAADTSLSQHEWTSTCKCADANAQAAHADSVIL